MAHHIQQQPHHHDENEPPRRSHVADPRDERDDRVSGRGRRTRIVVSGQGVVKKKPTRAVVTTTIEARASTAKDARTQEAAHVSGVKGNVTATARLLSERLSIQPNYRWVHQRQELENYIASAHLTYETVHVKDVGEIIDSITTAAPDAHIDSIVMGLTEDEEEDARQDALAEATKNAIAKLRRICHAAGERFYDILRISEGGSVNNFHAEPVPRLMAMQASMTAGDATAPGNVAPGELSFTASITIEGRCS